jgi:hypothetical protein
MWCILMGSRSVLVCSALVRCLRKRPWTGASVDALSVNPLPVAVDPFSVGFRLVAVDESPVVSSSFVMGVSL